MFRLIQSHAISPPQRIPDVPIKIVPSPACLVKRERFKFPRGSISVLFPNQPCVTWTRTSCVLQFMQLHLAQKKFIPWPTWELLCKGDMIGVVLLLFLIKIWSGRPEGRYFRDTTTTATSFPCAYTGFQRFLFSIIPDSLITSLFHSRYFENGPLEPGPDCMQYYIQL